MQKYPTEKQKDYINMYVDKLGKTKTFIVLGPFLESYKARVFLLQYIKTCAKESSLPTNIVNSILSMYTKSHASYFMPNSEYNYREGSAMKNLIKPSEEFKRCYAPVFLASKKPIVATVYTCRQTIELSPEDLSIFYSTVASYYMEFHKHYMDGMRIHDHKNKVYGVKAADKFTEEIVDVAEKYCGLSAKMDNLESFEKTAMIGEIKDNLVNTVGHSSEVHSRLMKNQDNYKISTFTTIIRGTEEIKEFLLAAASILFSVVL